MLVKRYFYGYGAVSGSLSSFVSGSVSESLSGSVTGSESESGSGSVRVVLIFQFSKYHSPTLPTDFPLDETNLFKKSK